MCGLYRKEMNEKEHPREASMSSALKETPPLLLNRRQRFFVIAGLA